MNTQETLMKLSVHELAELVGDELQALHELEEQDADIALRMQKREYLELIQKVIDIKKMGLR